jgi:hypothetical protein
MVLCDKRIVTAEGIREYIQAQDMNQQQSSAEGARVVARAWSDPAYATNPDISQSQTDISQSQPDISQSQTDISQFSSATTPDMNHTTPVQNIR